jgi:hypothetical protein
MNGFNVPESEKRAITSIDVATLRNLVDQAIRDENSGALHSVPLSSCGI